MNETATILVIMILATWLVTTERFQAFYDILLNAPAAAPGSSQTAAPAPAAKPAGGGIFV